MTGRWVGILGAALLPAFAAAPAAADPDKSSYSLFDPTPDDQMRQFSPDRPGKAQSIPTLDAGHFDIESDFINYTYDVTAGQETRSYSIATPLLKAGLTDWADLELGFALYNQTRMTDRASGVSVVGHGFGDIELGSKINLFGNEGGDQAFSILPFIKLPTASNAALGNGIVEYTLNLPYSITLPDDWDLTLEPIVSVLRNVQNSGYHVDIAGAASLSHSLFVDTLTASLEYFVQTSGDRHNKTFSTIDPALAWLVTPDVQLDLGIYIGLDDAAPDYNPYVGISYRY